MTASTSPKQTSESMLRQLGSAARADSPRDDSTTKYSRGMRRLMRIGWNLLPPLTFVAIVALWSAVIHVFKIPAYLLPGPGAVFSRVVADAPMLWNHSVVTLTEIVLGFALTVLTAIPLGLVIALSSLAKQVVYPPIMLMQLVPKIAVAPLFLIWLGFGIESKVLLTVLMTFFPLLLASISGFQILDNRFLVSDAVDGRDELADVPLPARAGGAAGDLLRHQDVGDHRRDGRDRRRIRRRQQGAGLRAPAQHQHDGHRAHVRRARRAHDHRHRDQLSGRVQRVVDDALERAKYN